MAVWLSVGGLLVGCMIGLSGYAAKTLPKDVRIPVHTGFTGRYNNYVSRTAGLITWPACGLLIYAIFLGASVGHVKPNHASRTTALIIMVVVLALLLAFQAGAIRAAAGGTTGRSE